MIKYFYLQDNFYYNILSEEDKQIAKAEGFTPADFVEAEERMDDILDTDEWEDKKR